MASPFYIPLPDMFGNEQRARQVARQQYAGELARLFSAGDMQAGQSLAGLDPQMASQLQTVLSQMPGTEQAKVKSRADLLKKWHMAIQSERDPAQAALMYNQMLVKAKEAGVDVSTLAPTYSPDAVNSQLVELSSFEEIARAPGMSEGALEERDRRRLDTLDPSSAEWQDIFLRRYQPKIVRTPSGDFISPQPIPAKYAQLAQQGGIVIPKEWGVTQQPAVPQRAPGELGPEAAAAAGLIPTPMSPKPVRLEGTGPSAVDIEIGKAEREERKAAEKEAKKVDADAREAEVYYSSTLNKFAELRRIVAGMNPASALFGEELTRARSIAGRLMTDIKSAKMADLGAITASDQNLLAGFVPDLDNINIRRFIPSQMVIPIDEGIQYAKDKAAGYYAKIGRPNPFANFQAGQSAARQQQPRQQSSGDDDMEFLRGGR